MRTYRLLPLLPALCLLAALPPARGDELPSDAAKRIKQFEAEEEAVWKKAEAEIKERRDELFVRWRG
jgi:hypothetical protein